MGHFTPNYRKFLVIFAVLAVTAACVPAVKSPADPAKITQTKAQITQTEAKITQAKAGEYLSAAELKKLHSGAISYSTSRRGSPVTIWYNGDGTYTGEIEGPGITFEGRWWTKEPDIYCTKGSSRTRCRRVKKVGNEYKRFNLNGTENKHFSSWEYKNKP